MKDKRVIVCNAAVAGSSYAKGALAYVITIAHERHKVLIRSRGGRRIEKWIASKNLENFRTKQIPPEHPLYDRLVEYPE